MRKNPLTLLCLSVLLLSGCVARNWTSTASKDTTPASIKKQAPPLISAFFGLDHGLPFRANMICRGAFRKNGMPVVFPLELDIKTLQAGDFVVETRAGKRSRPFCVTAAPAIDPGELRTILLIGEYGSKDDPPVKVTVVGNLLDKQRTRNFKGASIKVIPLRAGPTLVLAQEASEAEWKKKNGRATLCPADTQQVLRVTWSGGITRPDGKPVGELVRRAYRITVVGADGKEKQLVPDGLADLHDNDNNHELCLKRRGKVRKVSFPARLLVDPRGDLNPATSVKVSPPSTSSSAPPARR